MVGKRCAAARRGPAETRCGSAIFSSYLYPPRKRRTVPGGQEHGRDDEPSMAALPHIHRENCVAKIGNKILTFLVGPEVVPPLPQIFLDDEKSWGKDRLYLI